MKRQRELVPTYIGYCCREWILAVGYPVGRCGLCGKKPRFLREDDHEETQ